MAVAAASAQVWLHDGWFLSVDTEDGFEGTRLGCWAFGASLAFVGSIKALGMFSVSVKSGYGWFKCSFDAQRLCLLDL